MSKNNKNEKKTITYSAPKTINNEQLEEEIEEILIATRNLNNCHGRYIYSVFHSIMFLIAVYLSFRCNKGFSLKGFILALISPYLYIVYTLATQGTCGLLE